MERIDFLIAYCSPINDKWSSEWTDGEHAPNRKQATGVVFTLPQMQFSLMQGFDDFYTALSAWWWFPAISHPVGFQGWKIISSAAFSVKGVSTEEFLIHLNVLFTYYIGACICSGGCCCICEISMALGVCVCLMQCGVGKSIEGERQPAVCMSTPRALASDAGCLPQRRKGKILMIRWLRGPVLFERLVSNFTQAEAAGGDAKNCTIQSGVKFHLLPLYPIWRNIKFITGAQLIARDGLY